MGGGSFAVNEGQRQTSTLLLLFNLHTRRLQRVAGLQGCIIRYDRGSVDRSLTAGSEASECEGLPTDYCPAPNRSSDSTKTYHRRLLLRPTDHVDLQEAGRGMLVSICRPPPEAVSLLPQPGTSCPLLAFFHTTKATTHLRLILIHNASYMLCNDCSS